jgi:hypothetical protein
VIRRVAREVALNACVGALIALLACAGIHHKLKGRSS